MPGKIPIRKHIITVILLAMAAAFGFFVNRGIEIKGLYMDDLYMWSCYGEQSLTEFVFPIGTSTRFRPVYWLATYLQMAIVGTHVSRFAAFNIIINILVSWELFFMASYLADGMGRRRRRGSAFGRACGFLVSLCYLASRFAYYQIGQALGLMETMALAMSVGVLWLLLRCSLDDGPRSIGEGSAWKYRFYAALLLWFLTVFVHERYLSLFPLFYIAAAVLSIRTRTAGSRPAQGALPDRGTGAGAAGSTGPGIGQLILPAAVLAIVTAIRLYATGNAVPAGTGGTYVTDTFSISEAAGYAIDQVLYIFGANPGPEYLCGIEWGQTSPYIKRCVKFSVLFIGLVCILFAVQFVWNAFHAGKDRDCLLQVISDLGASLMFGGFIALCIGCSSVTIRLEMRWIYVSYAAALLYASYMLGRLFCLRQQGSGKESGPGIYESVGEASAARGLKGAGSFIPGAAALASFAAYAVLSIYTNIYCRGYFINIYFWKDQLRMNSLAEETVEKYGMDGLAGKNIYILENTYGMSDFYARTFLKPYDPDKKAAQTAIIFAESIETVPEEEIRDSRALVLKEVPSEYGYRDITDSLL